MEETEQLIPAVCPFLSVCNVGVLWPNGWTDPDETCTQVGLGPGHIVLDADPGPLPKRGTASQFSAHICCDQMARSIKMPLGRQVGLDPSDIVLDGTQVPLTKKGLTEPPNVQPMSVVAKRLYGSR